MEENAPAAAPSGARALTVLGLLLAGLGWCGLLALATSIYPNGQSPSELPLPRPGDAWTYLADANSGILLLASLLLVLAMTGTALPFTWFLNRRFSRDGRPHAGAALRQAVWVGLFAVVLLWLRANQTYSTTLMVITGGALVLVEVLMALRQRGAET
jgi:hypothetical protein